MTQKTLQSSSIAIIFAFIALVDLSTSIQQCERNKLVHNPINFVHMFWARADTELKSTEPATIVTFHYQNRKDMGNGQFEETVAFRVTKKPEFRLSKDDLGYYYVVISLIDASSNFIRVKTFLRGKISVNGQKWINAVNGGNNDLSAVVNRLGGLTTQGQDMEEKYCGRFLKFEYEYFYYMLKNYYSTSKGREYALAQPTELN